MGAHTRVVSEHPFWSDVNSVGGSEGQGVGLTPPTRSAQAGGAFRVKVCSVQAVNISIFSLSAAPQLAAAQAINAQFGF